MTDMLYLLQLRAITVGTQTQYTMEVRTPLNADASSVAGWSLT